MMQYEFILTDYTPGHIKIPIMTFGAPRRTFKTTHTNNIIALITYILDSR